MTFVSRLFIIFIFIIIIPLFLRH